MFLNEKLMIHLNCWSLQKNIRIVNTKKFSFENKNDLDCHRSSHYCEEDEYPKKRENWSKVVAIVEKAKYPFSFVSQQGYVKQHGNITVKLTIKNPLNNSIFRIDYAVVALIQQESNRESIPNQQWRISLKLSINNIIPGIIDRFILNKTVTVTAGRITNLEKLFSRLVRRNGIRGFYRELEFQFGPNNFKAEENKIFLNDSETGGYTNNYQFDENENNDEINNNNEVNKEELQLEFDSIEKDISTVTIDESNIPMKNESNEIYNEIQH
ncbi:hypothetical protein U3516DRAFT_866242 [Neocallimastix sp. 'constans']